VAGTTATPSAPERDFRSAVDGRLTQIWATPQGFIKAAIANNATVKTDTLRGVKKTIIGFTAPNKMKFEGVVGDQNLLERVETWYGSPVLGDTKFDAVFSGYKDFGGVKFPTSIVQHNGPYPILDLEVTSVKPNAAVSIEVPANIRNAPAPAAAPLQAERISEGLWMVQGTAKSVAIEMKDSMIVVEAPETEARSIGVIEAFKRAIPNKPITYLINTHHHFDHSGGLRGFASIGVPVITHEVNRAFLEAALAAPTTIYPDMLATSGRKATVEGFAGRRVLADETRVVEIHHVADNPHHDGLVLVYLPKDRILIEADAFNPLPANASYPMPPNPASVHLADAIARQKLTVDTLLPLHGRKVTLTELHKAIGRTP
jgi:glyoxylase-like metal-dependent hydrolase (beta-lactamase superfamily II)